MKKYLAMLLAAIVLLSSTVAFAAMPNPDGTQASNYFKSYGMAVSATGSGKLYLTFSCTGVGTCDQLGVSCYRVQKKNSSGSWVDVTGDLSGSVSYNTTSHSFAKIFNGVKGETYRVKCTFTCTRTINGVKGTETKAYTSGTKTAT